MKIRHLIYCFLITKTLACGDDHLVLERECETDDQCESRHCERTTGTCIAASCNDGVMQAGEECDDGSASATCDVDCTLVACGDGVVNEAAGEQCEAGAATAYEGICDDECQYIYPASCQDYLAVAPQLPSGMYVIDPPGDRAPVSVYCDMTTDGGGWTAVDPALAAVLGGTATAVVSEGTQVTCQLSQDGLFEAYYDSPSDVNELVCQYDIDLGFSFDTIRLSPAVDDALRFDPIVGQDHSTDVEDFLAQPWGQNYRVGGVGDIVIGTPMHPGPVLSLGSRVGPRSFVAGEVILWPASEVEESAISTRDTALRVQFSESGPQDEGIRWQAGRIYVRSSAQ